MHHNGAKYYREVLAHGRDYTRGLALAMILSALTVCSTVLAASSTFSRTEIYDANQRVLLSLYSSDDTFVNIARVSLGVGLLGSLTLMFCGLREALVELLSDHIPNAAGVFETIVFQNIFSLGLFAAVLAVTMIEVGDIVVFRVGRAVFGSLMIYVLPGVIFLRASRQYPSEPFVSFWQRIAIVFIGLLGGALALFGFVVHASPSFHNVA